MAATKTVSQLTQSHNSLAPRHGVVALYGYGIQVRVDRGHLLVEDGIGADRRQAKLPRVGHGLKRLVVIGSDGMLIDQYQNPWIWPVATATVSQVRIMAKYAYDRGARGFSIVYDTRYRFGKEGKDAYAAYVGTLPGATMVAPFCSVKSSRAHIVFTTQSGWGRRMGYTPSSRWRFWADSPEPIEIPTGALSWKPGPSRLPMTSSTSGSTACRSKVRVLAKRA